MDLSQTIVESKTISLENDDLFRIFKAKFIINVAKCLVKSSDSTNDTNIDDSLKRALKMLSIQSYLHLDRGTTLDIPPDDDCISKHREQKAALRQVLVLELEKHLTPLATFQKRFRNEFPEVFTRAPRRDDDNQDHPSVNECLPNSYTRILDFEKERRSLFLDLMEKKNRKCSLMKEIIETISLGSNQSYKLEIAEMKARIVEMKADLLRSHCINNFLSGSKGVLPALKEIETFIDAELLKSETCEEPSK